MRRDVISSTGDPAAAQLTYREVGGTRSVSLPRGYDHVRRDVRLGFGAEVFQRAMAALFDWRMHHEAGLVVVESTGPAAEGGTVILRAGFPRLGLTMPCRVVYAVQEARCGGFAYGTLLGHPEQGEESFMVVMADTDEVRFRIRAFSRPVWFPARIGGPLSRAVQQYATDRYVRALKTLATGAEGR